MATKRNLMGNADWKRIALGAGVSLGSTLGMSALFAWMMLREAVAYEWMNYLAVLTLLLSSFAGAVAARDGLEYGMGAPAAGLLYWIMLLGINGICFAGSLSGAGACALAILGGSGAAWLLAGRSGGKRRRRRSYRFR